MKIAISSCLSGNRVRYDGRDRLSCVYKELVALDFEFVAICPEVAIGMGVPRPPIQLVKNQEDIRVTFVDDNSKDVTDKLMVYAEFQFAILKDCLGYITAQRSPSCGFESAPVSGFQKLASSEELASGVFINKVAQNFPEMPISDEQDLLEANQLENFLDRVLQYKAKRNLKRLFLR